MANRRKIYASPDSDMFMSVGIKKDEVFMEIYDKDTGEEMRTWFDKKELASLIKALQFYQVKMEKYNG